MSRERRCQGCTKTGSPCEAPALHDRDFCWVHEPSNQDAVDEARRQGGNQRARQLTRPTLDPEAPKPEWWPLENAHHARAALAFITQEIFLGRLSARDGNAATATLATLANVLKDASMEDRLQAVEAIVSHRGPP